MLSCKTQFEVDIRNAIERTKWSHENGAKEPVQDVVIEQSSQDRISDPNLESRLQNELKNVDAFTNTMASYLSELKRESFGEDEDFNSSSTERIEVSLKLACLYIQEIENESRSCMV